MWILTVETHHGWRGKRRKENLIETSAVCFEMMDWVLCAFFLVYKDRICLSGASVNYWKDIVLFIFNDKRH